MECMTTPAQQLSLVLADPRGVRWAQEQVTRHHYLGRLVDARSRPLVYLVLLAGEPMGCLIFGRPEATRVNGWYGSVEDVAKGACPLTRWQVLNLARVWLHADLQAGGRCFLPNAASWAIAQALRRVGFEYLVHRPPVWLDEPYEIREVLSYCDTRVHQGTLYRAANFRLVRMNERGIATYARPLRRLTHAEHAEIARRSHADWRARRLRAARTVVQAPLFPESEVAR
jgi:hypothetical protein